MRRDGDPGARAREPRALLPVLILIGTLAAVISSLGAPLLPTIARTDHVSLSDAQWSLTATMLVGTVTAPVLGRLGDGPSRRKVILGSLGVVLVGSLLAAWPSRSFALLLAGRGLQGFGLGLMPLTMAVARDSLPEARAARAIALLSVAGVAGVGLGYPITGLLDQNFGLHSAFWFGVIMSALILAISIPVIPGRAHLRRRPLDAPGAILLGLALVSVLLAMTEGQEWGWSSARVIGLFLAGVVLGAAWVVCERSTKEPLVSLSLLRHASVAVTNMTALILGVALYMFIPLLADFVQTPPSAGYGSGASVVMVGLMLLPFSVLSTSMSRVAAALGRRIGPARVVPIGNLFAAVAVGLFAVTDGSIWQGFVAMGIAGIGVGFTFAAMPGLIVRAVPDTETGSALGFYQVSRFVGFAVGSALAASILAAYTPAGGLLPSREGFTVAFGVGAAVCLLAAAFSALLGPGADATGPTPPRETVIVPMAGTEEVAAEIIFE
jgi:MFS family permease